MRTHIGHATRSSSRRAVDPAAAEEFLRLYHAECPQAGPVQPRLDVVLAQIGRYGTYAHTADELAFGARVAWRNSNRCIGRLYWRSLRVRDRRHVITAEQVAGEADGTVVGDPRHADFTDHTESRRFLAHLAREQRAGRITPADWSWIVPPISGAATAVFHRYDDDADLRPNFVHHRRAQPTATSASSS